jgi:iron complex outermembrane receptor protein
MRAALLLGGLCWWVASPGLAQDRPPPRVQGVVLDSLSGDLVTDALVLLEGHGQVFTTGDGRFAFRFDLPPGEYLVAAVTRDCRIGAARLYLADADPVRLDLAVGLQRLEGAVVADRSRQAIGTGVKVTTRHEIQRMREQSVQSILRRLAPSMVTADASRPGSAIQLRERGVTTVTGSRTPLVLIDDVRVTDTRILESLDVDEIIRIEIAAGASGGWSYGLEGASGVIHIRTRDEDLTRNPYCGAASRIR